jgi:hypothetical protein
VHVQHASRNVKRGDYGNTGYYRTGRALTHPEYAEIKKNGNDGYIEDIGYTHGTHSYEKCYWRK